LLKNWPDNDGARVEAARVAVMLGNGFKAKSILEVGAKEKSASARLLGTLARLLMLSTESDVKNPEQALENAQRALEKNQSSQHQETLALCHASAGRFKQAVELQERLIKEAGLSVTARTRARMGKNLERYRAGNLGRLPFDAS
jgi:tetratricopeptide (TPR) repeat protein